MMASASLCLLVFYLSTYCSWPACKDLQTCIIRNHPEPEDISPCIISSKLNGSGDKDVWRVLNQCTAEYSAVESVLLSCDQPDSEEGPLGAICSYRKMLKSLTKLGTWYMIKDGGEGKEKM